MPEVCCSLLCRLLPVSGFGLVACQGFLVREAYVSVLVSGTGSLSMKCPAFVVSMGLVYMGGLYFNAQGYVLALLEN